MEFEAVIYKYGWSAFHIRGDNSPLRPNVEEKGRFIGKVFNNKKHRGRLYYIYSANPSRPLVPVGGHLFTSQSDCKTFCRNNGIKLGSTHFMCILCNVPEAHNNREDEEVGADEEE
ncbi:hypothetical protein YASMINEVIRUS_353 [Yasminevirus sp. GU-2018]|uniref:Uncharacterized protein n=1 Tax=Yasminevirus sp. GU-2018 TaxID=2420051 RepID=A0A5K0U7X4_9VIRU|nr:hypothetical protein YASMINEVIRUS_353 [Yasminevirus sp. GU-2018]